MHARTQGVAIHIPDVPFLAAEPHGEGSTLGAQEIFREIESRVGEPARPGHLLRVRDDCFTAGFGDDATEIPYRTPERGSLQHRPRMQCLEALQREPVTVIDELDEVGELGIGDTRRVRTP